jgi:REP element-mobilizing transposase RayT
MKGFDYSQEEIYFVTICSHKHKQIFGKITQIGETNLFTPSRIGELVEENYYRLPDRFPEFDLIHFSLLPNHLHFLTMKKEIGPRSVKSLSDLVGAFKSLSDKAVRNEMPVIRIWQKSFHDHIIRDEKDFQTHWQYIEENLNRWGEDEYFVL